MELIREISIAVYILINSVTDYKKRCVSLLLFMIWFFGGIIINVFENNNVKTVIVTMLPGVIIMIMSIFLKGAIGLGDGLVFIIIGLFLGIIKTINILFWSLILTCLFGLFLVFVKKKKMNDKLAFIPFVLFGFFTVTYI